MSNLIIIPNRPAHAFTDSQTGGIIYVPFTDAEMEDLAQRQATNLIMQEAEQVAIAAEEEKRIAVQNSVDQTLSLADVTKADISPELKALFVAMQIQIEGLQKQLGLIPHDTPKQDTH